MTSSASDEPFIWNLSGLLAEPPGSGRAHRIERASIDLGEDLRLDEPVSGPVRLARTNRGVLVNADLAASLALECSRCLREISVPVDIRIQEEYLPALDIATGRPVPASDEPDALLLSDHHELDLETPIREAIQLAEPIAPLCRQDCPGLCIVCGARLDEGAHDHPDDAIDPRLEVLRGFRPGAG